VVGKKYPPSFLPDDYIDDNQHLVFALSEIIFQTLSNTKVSDAKFFNKLIYVDYIEKKHTH